MRPHHQDSGRFEVASASLKNRSEPPRLQKNIRTVLLLHSVLAPGQVHQKVMQAQLILVLPSTPARPQGEDVVEAEEALVVDVGVEVAEEVETAI